MWQSAGLALILLVGLNAGVSRVSVPVDSGAAVISRREVHSGSPGRGEHSVIRAPLRRTLAAKVRRQSGSGQPAVTSVGVFAELARPGAVVTGGSVIGAWSAIRKTPYAPRAPPAMDGPSHHTG